MFKGTKFMRQGWKKKWTRRAACYALGIAAGWWLAGLLPGSLSASEPAHAPAVHAPESPSASAHSPGHALAGVHQDAGVASAAQLAPQASQIRWLPCVIGSAAGLFILAALVGPALTSPAAPSVPAGHDHAAHH